MARRIGLTLLAADRPTALAKACWELLESRQALVLAYVHKVARSIEYAAADLHDLLRHMASGVGHPVAIVDERGVLRHAGPPPSPELLARVDFGSPWIDLVQTPAECAASVRVHSTVRPGLRLLMSGHGLTDTQVRALGTAVEVAMPAVAARLMIDEVHAWSDASRSSAILTELLERKGVPDAELERRLVERGWRTAGWHLGVRVVGRGRLDGLELARVVTERLLALPADSHASVLGEGVSGWLTFTRRPSPEVVETWVRRLRELHDDLQSELEVATGIGSLAPEGAGLAATLAEATDAARLAVRRASTGWFLHLDRLGLTQLLAAWTASDTFEPAARSLLGALGPEEIRTLAAYLDRESSLVAAAAELGLHRNTLGPRIRRIEQLLAVDLTDPDVRLALHLACRVVLAGGDSPGP
ncbi:PucR family transcriptional regulator [Mobilicoccus massiliensis]|uniref:PucR family transcriptional regulator n=1 Tax=Mobilicoccus massiliensis TaxID=1522310 RepID=UPI001FEBC0DD|nr:PucR family transcriptional regulator [Mobilicoccus massiliensis]